MPSEQRESMIFPFRWFDTLAELEETDLRAMLAAIKAYAATGDAPKFKGVLKALWNEIKQRIDYDTARHQAISEKCREAANRRWQGDANACKRMRTHANACEQMPIAEADADANIEVDFFDKKSPSSPKPGKSGSSGAALKPGKIFFDYKGDCKIHGITADQLMRWREQFPALDIDGELKAASAWLDGNRKRRKTNVRRFLTNWLIRKQDAARGNNGGNVSRNRAGVDYAEVERKAAALRAQQGDDPRFEEVNA